MNNFFCDPGVDLNYKRDYSKGKSFRVSIWNEIDTYNNDDFIQDFVIYGQALWVRIDSTPSTNEIPTEPSWKKVLEEVSRVEFEEKDNTVYWKYEDESEWNVLFKGEVSKIPDTYVQKDDLVTINGQSLIKKGDIDDIKIEGVFGDVKTTSDIRILGGPLANNVVDDVDTWPKTWIDKDKNKIIPKDKTLQEILENLFFATKDGVVNWIPNTWDPEVSNPIIRVDETKVEMGSTITLTELQEGTVTPNSKTFTASFSPECGYFKADKKTWSNENLTISSIGYPAGTAELTVKWNGNLVNNPVVNVTTFLVKQASNTISVSQTGLSSSRKACPSETIYASTNTKELVVPFVSATIDDSEESKDFGEQTSNVDVTGAYYFYYGSLKGTEESGLKINEASIKTLSKTWETTGTLLSNLIIPKLGHTYVVAVPSNYTITQILKSGNDFTSAWTSNLKQIDYTLPDSTIISYNLFYCENSASTDMDFQNLQIGEIS